MPFLVETGAGIANANALASVAYCRDYAALRGVSLPVADGEVQVFIVRATDYVKPLQVIGTKTYAGQRYLPWPRSGLTIDDEALPADAIPTGISDAIAQLVVEQAGGFDIAPTRVSGSAVKREVTGPLETEYVVGSTGAGRASMPVVDALLRPFLSTGRASGILSVGRG